MTLSRLKTLSFLLALSSLCLTLWGLASAYSIPAPPVFISIYTPSESPAPSHPHRSLAQKKEQNTQTPTPKTEPLPQENATHSPTSKKIEDTASIPKESLPPTPENTSESHKNLGSLPQFEDFGKGGRGNFPILKSGQKPQFPETAWDQGIEGQVKVRIWVSEEGKILKSELMSTTDRWGFSHSVLKAIQTWAFYPVMIQRKPTAFILIKTFKFVIE